MSRGFDEPRTELAAVGMSGAPARTAAAAPAQPEFGGTAALNPPATECLSPVQSVTGSAPAERMAPAGQQTPYAPVEFASGSAQPDARMAPVGQQTPYPPVEFVSGSAQIGYGAGPHAQHSTVRGPQQLGGIDFSGATRQNYGAPTGWPPSAGAIGGVHGEFAIAPQRQGRSPGGRAWIGVGIAATVVMAGAVAAVATGGADEASAEGTPSMVSALTTSAVTRAPARRQAAQAGPPVVPGYQVVLAPDSGAAYDVPADWAVGDPGASGGFGKPPNTVGGKGYATEGKDYCPGSTRTVAFVTGSETTDTVSAATELGTKTAKIAYSNAPGGGVPGAPQPLDSLDGAQHGTFVETRGAITDAKPGCATEYSVYTFATSADIGSFVMVIAADTGVPNAVDPETAKRIFRSIRSFES
ncbi:hypothetical protein [Nocardia lijiangensis]|uniref:hypothetical protein n=1 Tax=Nocardia lijiangensis TaxID=299618 RepID=UPI00082A0DD1|nr:hypothetical protein [Nocardia lijiangensis]